MVRIGIIGIGFMGVTHFKAARRVRGGKVVALCTRDPKKRAGDWRSVQGNFGGGGGIQDLTVSGPIRGPTTCLQTMRLTWWTFVCRHRYTSERRLMHSAGKHVLLEKPMAISLRAADKMLDAAKRARRQFMVAQVLRFFPEFRYLKCLVQTGEQGKLKALQLKRIISVPDWGSWGEATKTTGGMAIDLHIHDTDFVNFLFGRPRAIGSTGLIEARDGQVSYVSTNYYFDRSDLAVSAYSGAVATKGLPFEHGYDAYFEKATVAYNSTHCPKVTLVDSKGKKSHPKLPFPEAFEAEIQEAVTAVASGRPSKLISAQSARDSLAVCLAEVRSVISQERVEL